MTTDPTLRDRIAEALMRWAENGNSPQYASMRRPETVRANAYSRADAVLAVLPVPQAPTTDRAVAPLRDDVLRTMDAPLCQTLGYLTPEQLLDAYDTTTRAASVPLTAFEREFLGFALDLAADRMASRSDEFGDEDETALESLRRLAAGAQQPEPETARTADGATALRAAADFFERVLEQSLDPGNDPRYCTAVRDIVMGLRRQADECTAGAQQQPTTCTATIASEDTPDTPDRCIAPAGHYDEQQMPVFTRTDRSPGGWHTDGQGHMWCDRAATATPHREQPAPLSAAETADQIATDLRNAGWDQRALGAQDVAAVLHAGERLNQQDREQRRG